MMGGCTAMRRRGDVCVGVCVCVCVCCCWGRAWACNGSGKCDGGGWELGCGDGGGGGRRGDRGLEL